MSATEAQKAAYAAKHYGAKESDVESKACAYMTAQGGQHKKFKSSNNRGLPDRIFWHPAWPCRVFYIEFKKRKKTLRKQQKLVVDEMRDQGQIVFECDNLDDAKRIIDGMVTFWSYP